MNWNEQITLGATGLKVGRLGIAASYGVPADAIEEAFDKGCNYFYWGSLRREAMAEGLRRVVHRNRDRAVVCIQCYLRWPRMIRWSLERGLRKISLSYADVLLLGWHNKIPGDAIIEMCEQLKQEGKIRFYGISSHQRPVFPVLAEKHIGDLFHVRYNAAHRGAEKEVFPFIDPSKGPGMVAFTATRWGHLIDPKRMPAGEKTPRAADCYRFCLSHPNVHVCMTAPKNLEQVRQNFSVLDEGPLSPEEMAWMHRIGNHLRGEKQ